MVNVRFFQVIPPIMMSPQHLSLLFSSQQLLLLDKKLDQMLFVCNALSQKTQLPEIRNPDDHV